MNCRIFTLVLFILTLIARPVFSATKSYSFYCNTKVIRGHHVYYEERRHTYSFTIEVISDNYGVKRENYYSYRDSFIKVSPEERYSVRIYNPMPVRVAVNLIIDGLNSITGNPCGPDGGSKWLIDPFSWVTIRGWQVNQASSRRFYFTSREDSYAQWRSYQLGKDVTVKCGLICAAYFWSKEEMERYFERHPVYEYPRYYDHPSIYKEKEAGAPEPMEKSISEDKRDNAGTGMGERQSHPVEFVDFHYDTGMYSESQTVKIYYDFGRPDYEYYPKKYRDEEQGGFAPEKD